MNHRGVPGLSGVARGAEEQVAAGRIGEAAGTVPGAGGVRFGVPEVHGVVLQDSTPGQDMSSRCCLVSPVGACLGCITAGLDVSWHIRNHDARRFQAGSLRSLCSDTPLQSGVGKALDLAIAAVCMGHHQGCCLLNHCSCCLE